MAVVPTESSKVGRTSRWDKFLRTSLDQAWDHGLFPILAALRDSPGVRSRHGRDADADELDRGGQRASGPKDLRERLGTNTVRLVRRHGPTTY